MIAQYVLIVNLSVADLGRSWNQILGNIRELCSLAGDRQS